MRVPLNRFESALDPWVALIIMPLFALANAGLPLSGQLFGDLTSPLALGIILGLVIGKQSGILGAAWVASRFKATLPSGTCWRHIYGAGWLGGIGFTMSLFIAELAFRGSDLLNTAKLAIFVASIAAGIGGTVTLRWIVPQLGRVAGSCGTYGESYETEERET